MTERDLREAFERDPADAATVRELVRLVGRERERKGELVDIWRRHAEAVSGSDRVEARMSLARSEVEARRELDAIRTLRLCVKDAPDHAEAFDLLGELLRQRGELDAAVEALRAAARLDPDAIRPRVALVACLDAQGRGREAERVLQFLQRKGTRDPRVAGLVRELMHRRG